MKQKKRENLLRNLHRWRKNFFFIYDVIVKQKKDKRSANHYSCLAIRPRLPHVALPPVSFVGESKLSNSTACKHP
jgi:hypothetical protein